MRNIITDKRTKNENRHCIKETENSLKLILKQDNFNSTTKYTRFSCGNTTNKDISRNNHPGIDTKFRMQL